MPQKTKMFGRRESTRQPKSSSAVASPYSQSYQHHSPQTVPTGNFYGTGGSSTTPSGKPSTLALSTTPTATHRRWLDGPSPDETSRKSSAKPLALQPQHRDARGTHKGAHTSAGNDRTSAINIDESEDDELGTSRGVGTSRTGPSKAAQSAPLSSPSVSAIRKRGRHQDDEQDWEQDGRATKRSHNLDDLSRAGPSRSNFSRSSPLDSDVSRDPMDCLSTPEPPPSKRHAMLGKQPAPTNRLPPQDAESPTRSSRKPMELPLALLEVGGRAGIQRHQAPRISPGSTDHELRLTWDGQQAGPLRIIFSDLEEAHMLSDRQTTSSRPPFLALRTQPETPSTKALERLFHHYDSKMSGPHPPIILWGKEEDRSAWQSFVRAFANQARSKGCEMRYITDATAQQIVAHPNEVIKKQDQIDQRAEQRRASQSPKMTSNAEGAGVPRSRVMQPRHTEHRSSLNLSDDSRSSSPPPLELRSSRRLSREVAGAASRDASPSHREAATYGSRNGAPRRQSARLGASIKLPTKEGSPIPVRPPGAPDVMKLRYPFEGPGSVSVFESDWARLVGGEFLNDTLVEFGLKYHLNDIKTRQPALYESLYVFNSFFYRQLRTSRRVDDCYQQVRKWTSKIDIFAKDYLVLPINENLHWYLAIVVNPGLALNARESSAEPRESTPPAGATRARKSLQGNVSINSRGNPTINSDGSDVEARVDGNNGNSTVISSRASSPASVQVAEQPNGPPVQEMEKSYSQLKIGADEAAAAAATGDEEGEEVDEIESDAGGAMATRLPMAPSAAGQGIETQDSIEAASQQGARGTQSDDIQPSSRTETFNFPLKPEFKHAVQGSEPPTLDLAAAKTVIDLSNTQEDEGSKDVEMVDGSSNIDNPGRGSLVGGGDSAQPPPKRRPVSIVPGESMMRAMSSSPPLQPQSHASSRPKPRPSANHAGVGSSRAAGSSKSGGAVGGSRAGGTSANAASGSRVVIDVDGPTPLSTTPRTSPNVTKTAAAAGARAGPSTVKGKRAEEAAQRIRGQLQDELVVLIFDSLGGTHPSVTKTVNDYLRCEALDKRKVRIAPLAKTINVSVPEQSNFSDCGLYILLYFERFFRHLKQLKEQVIPGKDRSSDLWGAESAFKARREWGKRIDDLSAEWKKKKEEAGERAGGKDDGGTGSGGADDDDDDDEGFEEAMPGGDGVVSADAKPGVASNDAKPGDAKPGAAKPDDDKSGDDKPVPAPAAAQSSSTGGAKEAEAAEGGKAEKIEAGAGEVETVDTPEVNQAPEATMSEPDEAPAAPSSSIDSELARELTKTEAGEGSET